MLRSGVMAARPEPEFLHEATTANCAQVSDESTRRLAAVTCERYDPPSDRNFDLPDLRWVSALVELRRLELPGTRTVDPDLTPILDLPHLEELRLPLRKSYRKQVFEFASHSEVFARVAMNYEEYDAFVTSTRGR